jgi:hypothetical protein
MKKTLTFSTIPTRKTNCSANTDHSREGKQEHGEGSVEE